MRLDIYLTQNGLSRSRARAKEAIENGLVTVNGMIITKASAEIKGDEEVLCESVEKYVSRGGYKLEKAICEFEIDLTGAIAVDIGASTGGFTDCMLQNGAERVYAIDSGHGQLVEKIKNDCRVINIEGCNIRNFDVKTIDKPNFVCVDVSFISLKYIFPKLSELISDGIAVCLIKPQFEAGKSAVNKHGIVKDIKVHKEIICNLRDISLTYGLYMRKVIASPIRGGDGNKEYLCLFTKASGDLVSDKEVKEICEALV